MVAVFGIPAVDAAAFAGLLACGGLLLLRRPAAPAWTWSPLLLSAAAAILGAGAVWSLRWQAVPLLAVAAGLTAALGVVRLRGGSAALARRRPRAGGAVGLAVLVSAGPYYAYPMFALPAPDGPYRVGVLDFEVVDPQRRGVLDTPADAPRRIPVTVWYPAEGTADESWTRPYLSRRESLDELVSTARNFGLPPFLFTHLHGVAAHSRPEAPVAKTGDGFPVAIFSHGFWSYRAQNTALMERLASHGFVVFSLAHPRDGAAVRLADGSLIPSAPQSEVGDPEAIARLRRAMAAFAEVSTHAARIAALDDVKAAVANHRLGESVRAWRNDVLSLIAAIESDPPAHVAPIIGHADLERRVHMGMSFGGSTAASACQADSHCAAVVNLDGENFDPALFDQQLRAPMLLLLTESLLTRVPGRNAMLSPTDYAWETWGAMGARRDIHRWRIRGLRHLGLMDIVLAARSPLHEALYGVLDRRRALHLQNDAVVAFVRTTVQGAEVGFPEAVLARYPELEVHDPSAVRRAVAQ